MSGPEQPQPALSVTDFAEPGSGALSPVPRSRMRAGFLIFRRPSDQDVLHRLPSVIVRDVIGVKFAIDGRHELEAARKLKR
jgi:hypothetical protein